MDGVFGVTIMDKNIKVNGKMDKYMGEVENLILKVIYILENILKIIKVVLEKKSGMMEIYI